MGCIYRRSQWYCHTEARPLPRTADRLACEAAGHTIEDRQSPVYWIKYVRGRKSYAESSGSDRKAVAKALLLKREGDIAHGHPVTPKTDKVLFDDAAADVINDYKINGKRSLKMVERKVRKHLLPYFGGRRLASITAADIRAFIAQRQGADTVLVRKRHTLPLPDGSVRDVPEVRRRASNAEINRELALVKRAFRLAVEGDKLLQRPPVIKLLHEDNVRTGFFEAEQLASVLGHLPAEIRALIQFASITGWRVASEVLPLEWRRVDFAAGEIRLDPGTTKNRKGRTFHMTTDLRRLLEAQHAEHLRLKKAGHICPYVFFREVAESRGGERKPKRIVAFTKAWQTACRKAGCPGRIPHDLRRTAVRNFVRAGVPDVVAMRLTGHKTRSVFDRYDIVSDGDLREAARKLDGVAGRVPALLAHSLPE